MKKALAMKCTQKQWDSIKDRVPKEMISDLESHIEYITNIYCGRFISNIGYGDGTYKGLEIHETFNAKIFLDACGIETDVYKITKKQVLELSEKFGNDNYTGLRSGLTNHFKSVYPDAFKKELEVGKWYKITDKNNQFTSDECALVLYSDKNGTHIGFGYRKTWTTTFKNLNEVIERGTDVVAEATQQEVESALISEAKRRGFDKGARYLSAWNNEAYCIYPQDLYYNAKKNCLATHNGNECVFQNGQWATIIQPEKMTLEQIEKELGRKIELI